MIYIIDTLEPLGNFFAVQAKHVGVGTINLEAVLHASELELAKKASKEYVDEQISAIPQPDITKSYVDTNFAKKSEIPVPVTKTSQLQNDSGFLTQHQSLTDYVKTTDSRLSNARPASDVYPWAKHQNKPTYEKSEIGLSNVDNTSDIDKPVSAATMAALEDKADILTVSSLSNRVTFTEAETNSLSARVDAIETGDWPEEAEILGIRTGVDGTEYPNAGTAVREQVKTLQKEIAVITDNLIQSKSNVLDYSDMKVYSNSGFIDVQGNIVSAPHHKCVVIDDLKNIYSLTLGSGAASGAAYGVIMAKDGSYVTTKLGTKSGQKIIISENERINCKAVLNWFNYDSGAEYVHEVTEKFIDVASISSATTLSMFDTSNISYDFSELTVDKANGYIQADGTYGTSSVHRVVKIELSNVSAVTFGNGDTTAASYGIVRKAISKEVITSIGTGIANTVLNIPEDWYDCELVINWFDYQSSANTHVHTMNVEYSGIIAHPIKNIINKDYVSSLVDVTTKYGNCVHKPFDFNGKTAIFCGDSITYGFTSGTTNVHDTGDYPTLFSAKVGCSKTNLAVGGACFCSGKNQIKTIPKQVSEVSDKYCDFLFIAGGVNDWQMGASTSEFKTTLESLCDYINTNFSENTNVIWITPINEAGWKSINNPKASLQTFRNIITETVLQRDTYGRFSVVQGNEFNFPTSDGNTSYINAMFGDKLHPSALGYMTAYVGGLCSALI